MTIIRKIKAFLRKKYYFLSIIDAKNFKIQNFNPFFILTFIVIFSVLFFISSSLINKKNTSEAQNFEEITKNNEFNDLTNFLISKINSPYEEIGYIINKFV